MVPEHKNKKNILEKIQKPFGNINNYPNTNGMSVKSFINKKENYEIKEFFNNILIKYPNLKNSYNNVMYLIRHNLDPDVVLFCKICHKPLNLRYGLGSKEMQKYCSPSCCANDPQQKNKRKQTNIKKYGAGTPMQSLILSEKIKQTNKKLYNVDFPFQNKNIQNKAHQNLNYLKRNETIKISLEKKIW